MTTTQQQRKEQARTWLRKVRGEGDAETKRGFLEEKGFTKEEVDELLEWDRTDGPEAPLFG
jgi:hypothetical protein